MTSCQRLHSQSMSVFACASPKVLPDVSHDVSDYQGSVGGDVLMRNRSRNFGDSSTKQTVTSRFLHDEFEVDYDNSPTDLYKSIEGKDWDGALARLSKAPAEAKTWVSRREANSQKLRWRLLPLHATCIFRSPLSLIESLLRAYPDGPQMKDDQGMLPIHLACRNGASKGVVLTLLTAFPESLQVKDHKGRAPMDLVEASSSQNKEAVLLAMRRFQQELAKGNGNNDLYRSQSTLRTAPNEVDYEHRTILFRLVLKKDWNGVMSRATSFPDEACTWIVTKGFNGNLRFLPLHKACVLNPPVNVVETLVAGNMDGVSSKDQDGWLPIHCACFYGASDQVVNALLVAYPKGAQTKDDEGRLPVHYACLKASPQSVVDVLLQTFPKGSMSKDDEGRLPIHHACSKGAPEGVIDSLLKASPKGAQSKDDQGRLPLHHASRKNASERIIRTLLRVYPRAAQVKDDQDKLAIHYACQNGSDVKIIRLLLQTYPQSINVKNGFGYTPLAEARAMENPNMEPVIRELEKFKADQDKLKVDCDDSAETSIQLSVMKQRIMSLEQALHTVANLGRDLKHNMKKTDDAHALLGKFADKLSTIDAGIHESPAIALASSKREQSPQTTTTTPKSKRSLVSPLRNLGRVRSPSSTRSKKKSQVNE